MIHTAFGQIVPAEIINGLIAEGWKREELTTEKLETIFFYEFKDNE